MTKPSKFTTNPPITRPIRSLQQIDRCPRGETSARYTHKNYLRHRRLSPRLRTRSAAVGALWVIATLAPKFATAQTPVITSVVNLASGDRRLAPGTLAAIFGSNLSASLSRPSSVPISVLLNGLAGSVLLATPQQLTIQLPVEALPGVAVLQVQDQGGRSAPYPLPLDTYAPGIFTTTGNLGSIWHIDGRPVTLSDPAMAGESLSLLATGLGPTNPAVPTGALAPINPPAVAATIPSMIVDGLNAPVQYAGLEPSTVGRYRVFFLVPSSLSAGNHSLLLRIANQSSNSVILQIAGPGFPSISNLVNGASHNLAGIASPGSIVAILGLNFGQQDYSNAFPATSVGGTAVTFNGTPAPIMSVISSTNQIEVLVPSELPEFGTVNVQVSTRTGTSTSIAIQMAPANPGIFRITDPSGIVKNNGSVVFANTAWLVVGRTLADALRIPKDCSSSGINPASVCGQPATPGDILQVYCTGLGKATPAGDPGLPSLPTGSIAPLSGDPLYSTVDQLSVSIGGIQAGVIFSGLVPGNAGVYQVNFQVPDGVPFGDEVPIVVTALNGLSDRATVAINLQ
jgi:uncharacterized protein (TIGR03437 family)